jgi:hypothetical protein
VGSSTVTLVDPQGRTIKSTDNGDGTATLTTSASGGGTTSSVKILDTGGTNTATVSAGGAVKVDGSAVTQPVSNASLPLPAGASTAAKQPALGTAGTASTDVLSVQGIASMTALKVDGSAVTQPVSNASLPLPAGASTAAKQPALGTAGSASADVLSVQGVTSMTALKTDGSGVTQPVSGTVTANAGTNLNTSALALDATLTGGTQQAKLTDGTNIANVLKSDGTSAGQNSQLVSGGHLTVSFTTTTAQVVGSTDAGNFAWVAVHITSQGGSSTVTFQSSNDNVNWISSGLSPAGTFANSSTTTGIWYGAMAGRYFRLNVTGIVSGTTAGVIEFFANPRLSTVIQASQLGAWTVTQSGAWNVGMAAAATGGYSFNNITTATTTTVKSGAGTLHALTINTKGVTSTATLYDNTAGSGTKIATVDTTLGTGEILYDVAFATGLTIVTAGSADITAVYK